MPLLLLPPLLRGQNPGMPPRPPMGARVRHDFFSVAPRGKLLSAFFGVVGTAFECIAPHAGNKTLHFIGKQIVGHRETPEDVKGEAKNQNSIKLPSAAQ